MTDHESRIREHARQLWKDAGEPKSGVEAYMGRARELAAIEENGDLTLRPLREGEDLGASGNPVLPSDEFGPTGEPAEPPEALENQGEFPGLADEGEDMQVPHRPEQKQR